MKPSELRLEDASPQCALLASREELDEAVLLAVRAATRTLRVMHRDLSVFGLSSRAATDELLRLLLSDPSARVRLLVDDADWLEKDAARLRLLQRRLPHALELRVASPADAVGDDAVLLADDHGALELLPSRIVTGRLWLHHRPHVQPWIATFDRRWDAGAHNLPVSPLGLA
jgi:hypothetical protein